MKSEKGISLIKGIFIFIVAIFIISIIIYNTRRSEITTIEWGYMASPEYYELRIAALTSEINGSGTGKLSIKSFNTLGRDVNNAKGLWFKNSDVNFKAKVIDVDDAEIVSLSDGEHVAIFRFENGKNYIYYHFLDKDGLKTLDLEEFNLLAGYRITID